MKHILIIDDSPTIRISVEHALKSLGHAMVCAENGRDALGKIDALIAQGHDIALCVLDVNMPEMDGISFLKEFRSRDKFTPVLILTTESEDDKIKEGRSHGASGWIIKPFKPDELLSVAKRFLK
ncbi:MAG TPA: response regulator [Spirochaetota bacterium]|nr:response regulator [Spirochaetota bacterium]HOS38898.1 response regulator [Spirochaetota bacterium]HPI22782.1 response regulator [Spirochaetota bacterium]HPU90187.1 response regulator [Spirochaetota bacterium]